MPKTPDILTHTVKALKSMPSSTAPSKTQYLEARKALGETFGTEKQKATIQAQEHNRIDVVGAMEGAMGYVMDSIEKGAEGLMTAGSSMSLWGHCWSEFCGNRGEKGSGAQKQAFSESATNPADIISLPEAEWKALLAISQFDAT